MSQINRPAGRAISRHVGQSLRGAVGLWLVIGIAAALRCWRPGLYTITWDEVNLLFRSLRLAQFGDWVWLSNRTSWLVIPGHSPFSNYVLALPYLVTSDPRAARLLVAGLGVAAVVLTYLTVRRYYGGRAARLAGLLLAVSVNAVEWSRFVWNPNLAQPLIALWLLTGLLGYYEGKRWALVTSWVALSLAVQAHIGNAALGLPALVLLIAAWRREIMPRGALVRFTLVGWGLALVTLIPWGIGLVEAGLLEPRAVEIGESVQPDPFSLGGVIDSFAGVVGATVYNTTARGSASSGGWFPPLWTDALLQGGAVALLVGAVGVVVGALVGGRVPHLPRWNGRQTATDDANRRPSPHFPAVMFALVTLSPLLLYVMSPVNIERFYVMALLFGAYPLAGVLLAGVGTGFSARDSVSRWVQRLARYAVVLIVMVWIGLQGWLLAGQFRWLTVSAWPQPLRAPLDTFIDLVAGWNQQGELVVLVENETLKYTLPDMQIFFWEVVAGDQPIRVVNRWFGHGVPLSSASPTVVVGLHDGATIPHLFGDGAPVGLMDDSTAPLRQVIVPPDFALEPAFMPDSASRFDNGARIIGLHTAAPPTGSDWPVTLIWQPGQPTGTPYQFSLRLLDADTATRYAQADFASLNPAQWQPGDTVYNPVTLPLTAPPPDSTDLLIEVVMYTLDDLQPAAALDDDGNAVAAFMYLR